MQLYRVDHLHLICTDIEESRDWYCNVFGGKVTFEAEFKGRKVYYVEINGFTIIMVAEMLDGEPLPATIQTKEGLDHFGFAVEDMDAAAEELKGKGVKFVVEPLQVRPGLKIAYIEAPDKVRIELSERT
ncbi:MAG: VOC family protein, partial [Desulfobulbaceae bacterium]|nr:VOC family protein [Desulfobulbaceae bacterium]